jgi:hypothetical protein
VILPNVTNPSEFEAWARSKQARAGSSAFTLAVT